MQRRKESETTKAKELNVLIQKCLREWASVCRRVEGDFSYTKEDLMNALDIVNHVARNYDDTASLSADSE